MFYRILIAAALLFSGFVDCALAQGKFVDIARQAEYVVKIQVYDKTYNRYYSRGTGFYVKEKVEEEKEDRYLIITADHVGRIYAPDTTLTPTDTIIRYVPTDNVRDSITVYFNDNSKRPFTATLLKIDRMGDIMVYELVDFEPKDLPSPARLSRSEGLEDGTEVMVVSAMMLEYDVQFDKGFGHITLSEEIISLPQTRLIRTDVLIHSGSSGSPLINLRGEVIGMMNASARIDIPGFPSVSTSPSYAVPVSDIRRVFSSLGPSGVVQRIEHGAVDDSIGTVRFSTCMYPPPAQQCDPHYGLVIVSRVPEGTLAARSGIQEGDIITAVDDTKITDVRQFRVTIFNYQPGNEVVLTILRFSPSRGEYMELGIPLILGKWTPREEQREN